MEPKKSYAKITGQTAAGASVAALIAWAWNINWPDAMMTPEVAAALGATIGPIIKYGVSWLPHPGG